MRKLVYSINLTLDGCCDHTKGLIPDDEMSDYYVRLLQDSDTFIYGRKTYQLMVPYWPDEAKDNPDDKFAQAFTTVKKIVVFSRTLDKAVEKNTEIFHTNLTNEILKLKQQPGKNLLTSGVDLPEQLIQLGLVDEYLILVQPLIVGEGRRLFEGIDLKEKLKLQLVESRTFKSGSILLRYLSQ
jgi:dihydrofolate reductase